jgi:hypothetical protein
MLDSLMSIKASRDDYYIRLKVADRWENLLAQFDLRGDSNGRLLVA